MSALNGRAVPSLYVHVPFCARKCAYCAFYSEAPSPQAVRRYLGALLRELEWVAPELELETVFFGGGTPSLLSLSQWEQVLEQMERLDLLGAREWTVECNPATVSLDKARLWRDWGINRVSLGVQSLDEALLQRLGRIHSRQMASHSYDLLRRAGFDNINLDLMFAIPGQSLEVWRRTLEEAMAMQSEHLACYEVTYEEDTPLFAQLRAGRLAVDEDLACAMYDELVAQAAGHGLVQYEVANFGRHTGALEPAEEIPARACRHNVNYWQGGFYHGLGPSAAGYVDQVRTRNWSNTAIYCREVEAGRRPIQTEDRLSPLQRAGEVAAFGLRMTRGWRFDRFQAVTGFDLRTHWRREMDQLEADGWGRAWADRFELTPLGRRFADAAGLLFLR